MMSVACLFFISTLLVGQSATFWEQDSRRAGFPVAIVSGLGRVELLQFYQGSEPIAVAQSGHSSRISTRAAGTNVGWKMRFTPRTFLLPGRPAGENEPAAGLTLTQDWKQERVKNA